jgi:hypothetical protein
MEKSKPQAFTLREAFGQFDMSDVFYLLGAICLNYAVFQVNDVAMFFFLGVQLLLAGLTYGLH